MRMFPLHAVDFYKTGHYNMYPDNTTLVYSNFTCRSDKLANLGPDFDHKVVFFGIQGVCAWLLRDLWDAEFFSQPKEKVVAKYKRRMDLALGENAVVMTHIEALHDLGCLPIVVKALPEGSRVNIRVPLFTIQNTLAEFFWLTNYIETQLSAEMWKPITVATIAYEYRKLFTKFANITGAPLAFVDWQGHDFSARGMSGIYDAASSGAAHLLSFFGTDTVAAIDYLEDYYYAENDFVGGSVPASEHSVMCLGGKSTEIETFRRLLGKYPTGILSIVSDTWDFWKVVTEFATELKQDILNRQPNALGFAKVVFRPDSGDPVKIICGDPDAEPGSPANLGAVRCLWNVFGGTENNKGYKTLNQRVGLIYGDSITIHRARAILTQLEALGFASDNIVFGIGSYTYQYITRDTFGAAVKATFGVVDGENMVVSKDPVTDNGTKKSASGLLRVECDKTGEFTLHENQTSEQERKGWLDIVFANGVVVTKDTLKDIRENVREFDS